MSDRTIVFLLEENSTRLSSEGLFSPFISPSSPCFFLSSSTLCKISYDREHKDWQIKILELGIGYLLSSSWPEVHWRLPKTIEVINIALGCPPELHGNTLLLKTPHTLIVGRGENKSALTRILSCCWPAFMVLKMPFRLLVEAGHQQSYAAVKCKNDLGEKKCLWVQQYKWYVISS